MLAISPVGRTKIYLRTGIQTNALMIRKRRAYDTSAGEEQFPVNAQGRAPNATRHVNGGAPLGARCTCANSWSPKGPLHTQKNNRCLCHVNSVQNYWERLLIAITEILRTFYYFGSIPNFEYDKRLYIFYIVMTNLYNAGSYFRNKKVYLMTCRYLYEFTCSQRSEYFLIRQSSLFQESL